MDYPFSTYGPEFRNTTLIGGFNCRASNEEINDWTEYVREKDDFKNYVGMTDQRDTLQTIPLEGQMPDRLARLTEIREHINALEVKLYALGNEWFTRLNVKREIAAKKEQEKVDAELAAKRKAREAEATKA